MTGLDETQLAPATALPEEAPPRPTRRWRPRAVTVAAFVAAAASLVGTTVVVPYYAIAPGEVVATPGLVEVVGGPSYHPEGSIHLVTVYQAHVTAYDAIRGWLDPDIDVLREKQVLPPKTSSADLRRLNLQLMDTSKETAMGVAFEALGYDAITGDGAEVSNVVPGSPAATTLKVGDLITRVDSTPVDMHTDAVDALGAQEPGDRVVMRVTSKGAAPRDVAVVLARQPDDRAKPMLGVFLRTRNLRFDFPFEVKVASERIGGPSAGLAYTLEVLDRLTPGELTGGSRVAATGTIELDGSVGEIGGIVQKTAAVEAAGIDLFLVPRGEYVAAKHRAGRGLTVAPVDDLDDALRILARRGGNGLALGRLEVPK